MGFGTYLKQARIQKGYKLNEMARKSGIDSSLISRIELDKRQATALQVKKFAIALDCSEATLLTQWYASKIVNEIGYSTAALNSLTVAHEMIQQMQESIPEYGKSLKEKLDEIDQHCQIIQANRAQNNFRIEEALEIEYTYHLSLIHI
jgi:transcriptional regulator with XRE-family HTH domain